MSHSTCRLLRHDLGSNGHSMTGSCVKVTCLLGVQIDAGAEVIITQPPLLWDRFEAWINTVQQYVPNLSKLSGQAADLLTVLGQTGLWRIAYTSVVAFMSLA